MIDMKFKIHKLSGQVMLISILILGFLTLTAIVVGILSIARESQSTLAIENKTFAQAAAGACAEQAIDRLGRDESYAGNEIILVGDVECQIRPVLFQDPEWIIETESQVGEQYARYRIVLATRAPVLIEFWKEVATF